MIRSSTLLTDYLWKKDISIEELADRINVPLEDFYRKFFGEDEFTTQEINRIVDALGLTEQETDWIFYDGILRDDCLDEILWGLKKWPF